VFLDGPGISDAPRIKGSSVVSKNGFIDASLCFLDVDVEASLIDAGIEVEVEGLFSILSLFICV
jgi:hypothetical protein